jgi:predicted membrane channel-forming protein YqfA (hemolysin III family)
MVLTFVFQILGMIVFINEPDSETCQFICCCPSIFGYHEIFHMFVVAAGYCVYLCNWSIIFRASNGLANLQNTLLFTIVEYFS